MARDSGLGVGELEVALARRRWELIPLGASEASGLMPTYEIRLGRARAGDGAVVIGLGRFVRRTSSQTGTIGRSSRIGRSAVSPQLPNSTPWPRAF